MVSKHRPYLLELLLELEIFAVAVQRIPTSKQQKNRSFCEESLVEMTLRLFYSISVVMTMMSTLLRQFR